MSNIDIISDLTIIMPELSLTALGLISLVLGTMSTKIARPIGYLIIIALSYSAYRINLNTELFMGLAFEGSYFNNSYSLLFKTILIAGLAIIFLGYLGSEKKISTDFMMLALFSVIGYMVAISAKDLLVLFMGLELGSLPSYIMAGFLREKLKSSEAGLKYFVLGSVSSAIMLFGISLIYGFTGYISYQSIYYSVIEVSNIGVIVGISMVIISLLFKMSIAPFHIWTPDVYEGAPTISVAIFSSLHKISIIAIFVAFISMIFGKYAISFNMIFKVLAILSLVIGALGGLMQKSLKRLMAYSTILNMGYVLLAIIADIYIGFWRQAFFVYVIIYSISVVSLLLIIKSIYGDKSDDIALSNLAGLTKNNKFLSFSLVILLSSMMGIPPLAGFFAKYYVLYNLISLDEYMLTVIAILASVIAAFYYLRIIKAIYFDEVKVVPAKASCSITIFAIIASSIIFLICFSRFFTSYFTQVKLLI